MRAIGTLDIANQDKVVLLRNKVLITAQMLEFSNSDATKMAILISELSRETYNNTGTFSISFNIQPTPKKELWFSCKTATKSDFTKTNAFQSFFDTIKETASDKNGYSYSFGKLVPNQKLPLTSTTLNKLKTNVLSLTEKELLLELEKKNLELTAAYEELKESQKELLNRTQEIAKVGGWEYDVDTKEFSITDEIFRIHGLLPNQNHTFQDVLNIYPSKTRTTILKAIKQAEQNGKSWNFEVSFSTLKNERKWVKIIGGAEIKEGKIFRVSGAFQDITIQKEAELQLAKQNHELEFKNKELEQFAYVASHDLQEPLRTINSYIELVGELYKDKFDEDGLRFMMHIENASTRMKFLIKDLLDYSRLGREKVFVNVDCNKIVKDVLLDLNTSISESKAVIAVDKLPKIIGLEVELKQLFQNLITNAIKFTKENSTPVIKISAQEGNGEWLFKVQDEGIGIKKKYFERVFTIFQRLHRRDKYPGTGIGLALCKKIVEMHRGAIWIESEFGKGTTFFFTIKQKNNYGKKI